MNNSEIFYGELQLIQDVDLAIVTKKILDELIPEYFFVVSASSTGKYHPWYSLGYGGLVRHTKAAVKIAHDLLQLEQNRHLDHDAIIIALILHDTFKHGVACLPHTTKDHPRIACDTIYQWVSDNCGDKMRFLFKRICRLILSHMGQWNQGETEDLPKPDTPNEKFVHLCDYLASRKYIIVEVN